jgi:predicted site-specific integrase-resolvase
MKKDLEAMSITEILDEMRKGADEILKAYKDRGVRGVEYKFKDELYRELFEITESSVKKNQPPEGA